MTIQQTLTDEFRGKLNLTGGAKLKVVKEVKNSGPEWIVYVISGINARELVSDKEQENLHRKMRELLDNEENFAMFLSDFVEDDALFYTELFSDHQGQKMAFKKTFGDVARQIAAFVDEDELPNIKSISNTVLNEFPPDESMGEMFLAIGELLKGNRENAKNFMLEFLCGSANSYGLSEEVLATKMLNRRFEIVKILKVRKQT